MVELKNPERKQECSKLMAAAYNIPADDAMKMFDDAHNTNWAENYQFFLNQNNPTNFKRVWRQSYFLYRQIGTIQNPQVPFDRVMDFSVIQKLGGEAKYKSQTDEYPWRWPPRPWARSRREPEILTNTVVIHLPPTTGICTRRRDDGSLYDPNVDNVLEGVGKLVGTFGGARVIIEGHTDSSMRGQVPADVVKTLSMNRGVGGPRCPGRQVQGNRCQPDFMPTAWAGTARPIRKTRSIRPRTAASRSRSTRPRNNRP